MLSNSSVRPPRLLIIITLFLLALLVALVFFINRSTLPEGVNIKIKGQPTIGYAKAKVHLVAFEEPKCSNCKLYSQGIFPKIKKAYIDTNKITYTIIPVSFLPGSMPAAIALLCIYYSDPMYPNDELFFSYLDTLYELQPNEHTDWATPSTLTEFAEKTSPAINTQKLKKCIDKNTYRVKIQKNTNYAKQVMNGKLGTPTLYVNGIEVEEMTFDSISKLIDDVLDREGVYNGD